MSPISKHPIPDLCAKVQKVLERTWKEAVQLDEGTIIGGREHIQRFSITRHDNENTIKEKWIPPGGKSEPCETPEECVLREVCEETD